VWRARLHAPVAIDGPQARRDHKRECSARPLEALAVAESPRAPIAAPKNCGAHIEKKIVLKTPKKMRARR